MKAHTETTSLADVSTAYARARMPNPESTSKMEDDALVGYDDTVMQNNSPNFFDFNPSCSTTKQQEETSFANDQDADDEVPTLGSPSQGPQRVVEPTQTSDTIFQHMDHRMSKPTDLDESNRDSDIRSDSDDDIGGDTSLWCQRTKLNHGDLLWWGLSICPSCGQNVNKPLPKTLPQKSKIQGADTAASKDQAQSRRAQLRYTNRFLWSNGGHIFSEPWPELFDLDRYRGKLAMTQGPKDQLELEIVTKVVTNLPLNSRPQHSTNWIISNTSMGTEYVGKDFIIHSERVVDALEALVPYYPKVHIRGLPLLIPQPYALFYHNRDEIQEFQSTYNRTREDQPGTEGPNTASRCAHLKICDEETYKQLDFVRGYIERENLREVQEEVKRHQQKPAAATYSMLWLLFKPGTKVYVRRLGSPVHCGVVLSIQGGGLKPERSVPFSIDYWTLEFDGTRMGRFPLDFAFKPFPGEKRIAELEVTPCNYYDAEDSGVLRDTLLNRGVKFWKFLPGFQVDYKGKLPKDQSDWVGLFLQSLPPRRSR